MSKWQFKQANKLAEHEMHRCHQFVVLENPHPQVVHRHNPRQGRQAALDFSLVRVLWSAWHHFVMIVILLIEFNICIVIFVIILLLQFLSQDLWLFILVE